MGVFVTLFIYTSYISSIVVLAETTYKICTS